jgi:hypothetical protein
MEMRVDFGVALADVVTQLQGPIPASWATLPSLSRLGLASNVGVCGGQPVWGKNTAVHTEATNVQQSCMMVNTSGTMAAVVLGEWADEAWWQCCWCRQQQGSGHNCILCRTVHTTMLYSSDHRKYCALIWCTCRCGAKPDLTQLGSRGGHVCAPAAAAC